MTPTLARQSGHSLLGIYLNDHLAGATAGAQLAQRVAGSHQSSPDSDTLRRLATEIAEDRAALLDIMATLSVPVRGYKVYAALLGEKAARLKPNGYVTGRSPLSSLVELEVLRLGVEGKAAGWRTLRSQADRDSRLDSVRLDELMARARGQAVVLEELRVRAADEIVSLADHTAAK